jgi:Cd2+/Zn2+-exporting ATPase
MERRMFKITGMDCAEEVAVLKSAVGPIVGGPDRLGFDVLNGTMSVPPDGPDDQAIQTAVSETGMKAARLLAEIPLDEAPIDAARVRGVLLASVAGALLAIGMTAEWFAAEHLAIPCYLIATVAGSWQVLPKALSAVRRLRPDMNLLMVVAVIGAWLIGEGAEAATVAFLFALSLALEAWSVSRARRAVRALLDLSPPVARVKVEDRLVEKPVGEVPIGSVFVVNPGERVPLDGEIVEGESFVDQAPLTGESVPVTKAPGHSLMAGSINGEGKLEAKSTKAASDTTLSKIVRMVGSASNRRAPAEQWVEKFAAVYTPTVMILALVLAFALPTLFGKSWREAAYESLALLVIACPCALVVSTPVTIVAATAAAARHGVLIKGGAFVEAPATVKAMAFDKTGTLTIGKPQVVESAPLNGTANEELLKIASALESATDHPLARAVHAFAKQNGVEAAPAEGFRILSGRGAEGRIDGKTYWAGSQRLADERGALTPDLAAHLEKLRKAGRTPVVIGQENRALGVFGLADTIRPESASALAELRSLGVSPLVMLTGDDEGPAAAIAKSAGITEIRARLLPDEKVAAVEALVQEHGRVAMVGDGVNDAPALGRATFGVAMGLGGSDAAVETADVTLMTENLSRLPWLVRHSRRAVTVIRQNVSFSLVVKAVFAIATLAGYATMWGAVAADAGATVLVVANGLRLLASNSSDSSDSAAAFPPKGDASS